jgi:predicted phosphodiesterase
MIFIGDIHGSFNYYQNLVKNVTHTPTIQVGDFGMGFPGMTDPPKVDGDHWFIRGNHDSPDVCRKHPNYLGDYGYKPEWGVFYVSGADSIDKHMRIEGVSWWRDEELDYGTFINNVIPLYEETKPRIVVTHTCPMGVRNEVLPAWDNGHGHRPSVTERALQAMFDIHQPDLWVFGHWHIYKEFRAMGTRFVCVNSLQMIEIEGRDIV